MFERVNYQFCKVRMKIFIKSINRGIKYTIINGPFIHIHVVGNTFVGKTWFEKFVAENKTGLI